MQQIDPEREFQFWEYSVSHGSALIRSPREGDATSNVDILLFNVQYVSLPRFLGSISIEKARADEVVSLERLLPRPFGHDEVWAVLSNGQRYLVVASKIDVRESDQGIFESPFDH